jgi:CBS domain containing-hemolysin-like protein
VGESIEHAGRRYTVAEMAGRRISRVTVQINPPAEALESDDGEATA